MVRGLFEVRLSSKELQRTPKKPINIDFQWKIWTQVPNIPFPNAFWGYRYNYDLFWPSWLYLSSTKTQAPCRLLSRWINSLLTHPVRNGRRPVGCGRLRGHQLVVLGVGEADERQMVAGERPRRREVLRGRLVLHLRHIFDTQELHNCHRSASRNRPILDGSRIQSQSLWHKRTRNSPKLDKAQQTSSAFLPTKSGEHHFCGKLLTISCKRATIW